MNTLGWASFLIYNDGRNPLHQHILGLKENDTVMIDPVTKPEVNLSVPRYLGEGQFLVDDEVVKTQLHTVTLLTDNQDSLIPLFQIAQSLLFGDADSFITSIHLFMFLDTNEKGKHTILSEQIEELKEIFNCKFTFTIV